MCFICAFPDLTVVEIAMCVARLYLASTRVMQLTLAFQAR
jgi:hypothetical protein